MPAEAEQSTRSKSPPMLKQHQPPPRQRQQQIKHQGTRTVVPMHPSQVAISPVSKLDSILGNFYLRTILFFDCSSRQIGADLCVSLSEVLDLFPFVSGRLRVLENGSLGIKCNDAGVRFREAICESSVKDCIEGDASMQQNLFLEVRISDYSVSPLLAAQATRFSCGGFAIGISWCHLLADFMSMGLFVKLWGEASRKPGSFTFTSRPCFFIDKSPDLQLPHPFGPHNGSNGISSGSIKASELDTRVFHFPAKLVETITRESGAPEMESLCAVVWKAIANAQPSGDEPRLCLWTNTNSDKNRAYFGNAATAFKFVASSSLSSQSIADAAKWIQLGTKPNGSYTSFFATSILFCVWAADVPIFDDADFGFSKPLAVQFGATPLLGDGMVTIACRGQSKSVSVSLGSDAMKRLLQDRYFAAAAATSALAA